MLAIEYILIFNPTVLKKLYSRVYQRIRHNIFIWALYTICTKANLHWMKSIVKYIYPWGRTKCTLPEYSVPFYWINHFCQMCQPILSHNDSDIFCSLFFHLYVTNQIKTYISIVIHRCYWQISSGAKIWLVIGRMKCSI